MFLYLGEVCFNFPTCDMVSLGGGSNIAGKSFVKPTKVLRGPREVRERQGRERGG